MFLSFFVIYAAAAIIWLTAGFAPFLVDIFPSLRETLRQWRHATEAPAWVSRVPLASMLVMTIEFAASRSGPPAQVILQYLFSPRCRIRPTRT